MERTPGTTLAHATSRSSTSARPMRAAVSQSGAVANATRTSPSEPGIAAQESAVLRQRESIGHARDVVGDGPRLAVVRAARTHLARQAPGIGPIGAPELGENAAGALVGGDHVRVMVEVPVQEVLELAQRLLEPGRV